MKVCLYGYYQADQRISMKVYIDSLVRALENSGANTTTVSSNSSLTRYSNNRMIMRLLRYVVYPCSIKNQIGDIHHIIDHGYAHLWPKLASPNTCITVHDLIPFLSWNRDIAVVDQYSDEAIRFRKPLLNLHSLNYLQRYKHIVAISQSTYDDLVKYFPLDQNKISVVPPIIGSHFAPVSSSRLTEFVKQYDIDTSCKWLMISGGGYYKNHETCLRVLQRLNEISDMPIKLIRSGHHCKEFDKQVEKMALKGLVRNLYLDKSQDLPMLYTAVDCLLFPSLYEGFGMPVAEALACGTPVVASNRGALPEIAPTLIPHLDPYDVNSLAKAVYNALFDPMVKNQVNKLGGQAIEPYRSKVVIDKLNQVYQACLS